MKKFLPIIIVILIVTGLVMFLQFNKKPEVKEVDVNENIRLNTPKPNDVISSPLFITGEARGTWFFEGQFPVELRIPSKPPQAVVATGIAHAQGEWTTENFVPFTATLTFDNPTDFDEVLNPEHSLILELRKDNPSGLPQNDDSLDIPVILKK
jgi:hypothetical protein